MVASIKNSVDGKLSPNASANAYQTASDQDGLEALTRNATLADLDRFLEIRVLQAAQSDQNIGRIAPNGYASGHVTSASQRRESERNSSITLTVLLMNASYRVLHEQAVEALDEAEREIAIAIEDATDGLDDIRAAIDDLEANALRGANGNAVYVDGNRFVYANGEEVPDELAASVVAKQGVEYPTYAEYLALREAESEHVRRIQDLEALRGRLDGYRDELNDDGNPPSPSRLPVIIEEIEVTRSTAHELTLAQAEPVAEIEPIARPDTSAVPAM